MRPSFRQRASVLSTLRAGAVNGRLSLDTWEHRTLLAEGAADATTLRDLVADLPAIDLGERVRRLIERLRPASPIAIHPPPACASSTVYLLGRGLNCSLIHDDPSVSRQHASLRPSGPDAWTLVDLKSTNGTFVNGWRVEQATVRPGDVITLGRVRFVLADPG